MPLKQFPEIEVLRRLLNGDSMRSIGMHMRLSSTTIFRIKQRIIDQMIKNFIIKLSNEY